MKKNIVFALAALSLAATVRGASVDWASGDLNVSAIEPISSVTAYYYVIEDGTAAETAIAGLYDNGNGMYSSSDLITGDSKGWSVNSSLGAGVPEAVTATGTKNSDGTWSVDKTIDVNNDTYVLVVYEAKSEFGGTYAVANIGYFEGLNVGDYLATDNPNNATSAIGSDAIAYESSQSGGSGWAAVPEPTTVALLALGLAAVGLKRKVA